MSTPALYTRIGITASRYGITRAQQRKLVWSLEELRTHRGAQYLHHGDCQGGDYLAAVAARNLGYVIVGHPPTLDKFRAFFPSDEERAPQGYMARDRELVHEVDLLLGCPNTDLPRPHSGTWYTLTYAKEIGTKAVTIVPDGWWAST